MRDICSSRLWRRPSWQSRPGGLPAAPLTNCAAPPALYSLYSMLALGITHNSVPLAARKRGCALYAVSSKRQPQTPQGAEGGPPALNGTRSSQAEAALPAQQQQQQSLELGGAAAAAPPPAQETGLQLHYRTSWERPVLHHSINGGEWQVVEMQQVVSGNGWWKAASLDTAASSAGSNGSASAPQLEFVVTDGYDHWDKAPDGGNYVIQQAGRWQLAEGELAQAERPPVLLVSDLDDTMIGDDAATAAFTRWWQEEAVPAGGRLVFNTGRALDLFQALLVEKGDVLAQPDMLISAIGTRIYAKNRRGAWEEDEGYTASLGAGWQLEGVREACYRVLANVGKDAMHFRPPNEMSEHKVTCGVRVDVLEGVVASISADLAASGVAHRLVVSGSGGWRFVDLVPRQAGKLQALEYARRRLGFAPEHTVAAGDSGNDIDMLEGEHKSIIVGNAHPELFAWADARRAAGTADELHVAQAHRAQGILEGLQRWGFKA
ncbi:hypothetical protein ABPG75_009712 [Micractinium tetrahymenae]